MGPGTVTIGEMEAQDTAPAAALISRAMYGNPIHAAVFGGSTATAHRKQDAMWNVMFHRVFSRPRSRVLVAKQDGGLVGAMHMVPCPRKMSPVQGMRLLPGMLTATRSSTLRVLKWLSTWAKYDPKEPHLHIGPLAVAPELQGQGIGSRLLKELCEELDKGGRPCYLETDKPENVRLYERFGFQVVGHTLILGIQNWFMWRTPQSQ